MLGFTVILCKRNRFNFMDPESVEALIEYLKSLPKETKVEIVDARLNNRGVLVATTERLKLYDNSWYMPSRGVLLLGGI